MVTQPPVVSRVWCEIRYTGVWPTGYSRPLSAVLSIPDSSPNGRRTCLEIQSAHDQLPDRSRDDEFDRVARIGLHLEDGVAIPLADTFDRSDRPPLDVVSRFPGVDSIVRHRQWDVGKAVEDSAPGGRRSLRRSGHPVRFERPAIRTRGRPRVNPHTCPVPRRGDTAVPTRRPRESPRTRGGSRRAGR